MRESVAINAPQGIGDNFWIYQKLSPFFNKVNFNICVINNGSVEARSVDFLKLLPKVEEVSLNKVPCEKYDEIAKSLYKVENLLKQYDNGEIVIDYCCNGSLEAGIRLEDMDPGMPVEWGVDIKNYPLIDTTEYVVLYVSGSNKGHIGWSLDKWCKLVKLVYEKYNFKCPLVIIGAAYDVTSVYLLYDEIKESIEVSYLIDKPIANIVNVIKNAKLFIGFQSGLNIIADNFDVPQIMLYFTHLEKMMNTWRKPENNQIFNAFMFHQEVEDIISYLPNEFFKKSKLVLGA